MNSYLPFIFVGIASGSVYALAGVGLILTYKTSGTFNFAHGALATVAAYVFYTLHVSHGVPWPVAAVISVGILGPLLGLGFERFGRGVSRAPMVWRIAATVGILVSVEGLFTILYGPNRRTFGHFLPDSTFSVLGADATWEQLIIAVVALAATAGLSVLFRVTRIGIAMRAVVDDPDNLDVTGTNPVTVRRWAWVIGCFFAALSGLLLAPSVGLDPEVLTLLIVQAFGAAAVGGFSSIPMTYAGGIGIGIIASLSSKYSNGGVGSVISGLPASLPFIVLFLILVFSPRARLAVKEVAIIRRPAAWRAPARAQYALGAAVVLVLLLVPAFVGFELSQWTLMLTQVILFLSLGLLLRSSGQVSLCQSTFAAIGAAGFSKLAVNAGIPWFLALLLAGLIAVPAGALLAIPAIRRSGLYLALATFGFALLVQNMLYQTNWMFGSTGLGASIPTPGITWMSSTTGYYYVVLAVTVAMTGLTVWIARSRLGRLLAGVSDSPLALSAQGASVNVALVLVFCISAFMAAVSGALGGGVLGVVSGQNYDPFYSLLIVATLMITVGGEPWYGLLAAAPLALIPVYVPSSYALNYLQLTFGIVAVSAALRGQPPWRWMQARIDRWFAPGKQPARAGRAPAGVPASTTVSKPAPGVPRDRPGARLAADAVAVRYGGLVAVQDFEVTVEAGRITGLIGPNGAGKSSALNVCSGMIRPAEGSVTLDGRDVRRRGVAARARLGIGRTFQHMELFETLTVRQNLALGREGSMAGAAPLAQILSRRGDRAEIDARVADAAARCGLEPLLDVQVGALPTGQRRLVEFGRCLAGPFRVLLLDEPSSGLDHGETREFGRILRQAVDERNLAVLLVEHDMRLVMSTCDQIYVMEFGKILFKGNPAEVRRSEAVRAAYLGTSLDEEPAPQEPARPAAQELR